MNKVVLMGRLTRDPNVRYSAGDNPMAIARYTLAVDRRFKREGEAEADFISCVTFGKSAEFAEKYFHQGLRITISGRIQTGSYTNNEGNKIYTTEVVVEEQEFAESKNSSQGNAAGNSGNYAGNANTGNSRPNNNNNNNYNSNAPVQNNGGYPGYQGDGFMNIPEGLEEELPFN